ncbi:Amylo-alpha-1,6-glucosidase [Aquisphaera giovannonii]|uniref:Amylo-alpha-1,6-glucosidase n=1 Tax=Aquisphaera giovannonii TaxID=406548 RepID=A0A5B9VUZ6_9BACT|nr:amylo-alpha-1,6-glucosidase [Aquisphaera giovannonii]QEH31601.1 Amylo-alpha-1,6-glucosidase [Aquisphaera giovannonii]
MNEPIRLMRRSGAQGDPVDPLLSREWLVTNGLGGYASGTVSGVPTRRYHGLLVAALPAPLGRVMMFNRLSERVLLPGGVAGRLGGLERGGSLKVHAAGSLVEFALEAGLPAWRYRVGPALIEKRILLPHGQNTVHVTYRLLEGVEVARVTARIGLNIRGHDAPVSTPPKLPYTFSMAGDRFEVQAGPGCPTLRLHLWGTRPYMVLASEVTRDVYFRIEAGRGYSDTGDFWSPGAFRFNLRAGRDVTLGASAEPWATFLTLGPEAARAAETGRRGRLIEAAPEGLRAGLGAELVLAADQFLIAPAGRSADAVREQAEGDEARTVIAGYHWFTDWGRDTMISLEGLTLATGRTREAGSILRTFGRYVRDGLIPNFFPDGKDEGVYHTADATLWFFHALGRYVEATGDRATLRSMLPTLIDIVDHHRRGTRFGIGVDPADGLLRQGAEGYQLTWMDAKMDGWVVTPRRGKAVEINALWYNALRLLEGWARAEGRDREAGAAGRSADQARASFNRRFWNEAAGCLFDVVDGERGDDPACRPNQLFAISLDHPVLDPSRWAPVLETARAKLFTPLGLRSLAPGEPDYKPRYDGDLRTRDGAYHQGTVWAWLIGPYVDAWRKVHPGDEQGVRDALAGFASHLDEAGVGTISEIFDAEPPYEPRGCIAQAWSVAEVLRGLASISEGAPTETGAPPRAEEGR